MHNPRIHSGAIKVILDLSINCPCDGARIRKRAQASEKAISARMEKQWPEEEKAKLADL